MNCVKTYRVREQDAVVVTDELVELDFTLGGDGCEVRGGRAETETISQCQFSVFSLSVSFSLSISSEEGLNEATYGARFSPAIVNIDCLI